MNNLYLLGNGFDLAHGLKTNYNDFIEWFLKDIFNNILNTYKNGRFVTHDENIFKLNPTRINRSRFYSYTSSDFYTYFKELIPGLIPTTDFFSSIIKYYLNVNGNEKNNKSWFDIEQEYYVFLSRYASQNNLTEVKKLNLFFGELNNSLKKYIQEISSTIDNVPIIEYNSIFENSSGGNNMVINFNYTSTFEKKYAPLLATNDSYIPIHGKSDSNIVFGYGDEMSKNYEIIEDIGDNEYLSYFKSFAYFKNDNYSKLKSFINSEKYKISILGHSCGLSDRLLLNELFEHPLCSSIEIYYHKLSEYVNNFTDLTMNISRHFSDKKKLRDRIMHFNNKFEMPQYVSV